MTTVEMSYSVSEEELSTTYKVKLSGHAGNKFVCFALSTLMHTLSEMTSSMQISRYLDSGAAEVIFKAGVDNAVARTIYSFVNKELHMLECDFPTNVQVR